MPYRTAARPASVEEVVKGSRFIASAAPVAGEEEAMALLSEARVRLAGASHHAWAFRAGQTMRFSDDGEPGGTAGRPVLEVLLKRELDRVAVVVSRFFGGTKLGAGGLVRAYGGAAAKALDLSGVRIVADYLTLEVRVPFAEADTLHRLLSETRGARLRWQRFSAEGLLAAVSLPEEAAGAFRGRLADQTRGRAEVLARQAAE